MPESVLRAGMALATLVLCTTAGAQGTPTSTLPAPLVFLRSIDPTIHQDIRYATKENFTGRPAPGYASGECVLLSGVAVALARVQRELAPRGLSLRVYDCYRPRRAAQAMAVWVRQGEPGQRSPQYHPNIARERLIELGYIAAVSGHSRGDSVDVTLVRSPPTNVPAALAPSPCHLGTAETTRPPSLDMGTAYDCFDPRSHILAPGLTPAQREARRILHEAMGRQGFRGYTREWWHFSLDTAEGGGRSFDVVIPTYPQ